MPEDQDWVICIIIVSVLPDYFFLLLFYGNVLKLPWSMCLLFIWFYGNILKLLWDICLLFVCFQKCTGVTVEYMSAVYFAFKNVSELLWGMSLFFFTSTMCIIQNHIRWILKALNVWYLWVIRQLASFLSLNMAAQYLLFWSFTDTFNIIRGSMMIY